ncbi:hypothetical protein E1283_05970 [Streptomyces hainanensis]|uniref:Tn3 transposase DDE domain-containing protein n=1 Tax=Streptomyces hainanensis TaxID=402648 RepID=A0A4R4TJE9_9ACTN|nr:hypothetical protein E1283_05970 [Streptomyces hainanensis]
MERAPADGLCGWAEEIQAIAATSHRRAATGGYRDRRGPWGGTAGRAPASASRTPDPHRNATRIRYLSDPRLREQITRATNKAEAYNGYTKWLHFGTDGYLRSRDPELQEKAVEFLMTDHKSLILVRSAEQPSEGCHTLHDSRTLHVPPTASKTHSEPSKTSSPLVGRRRPKRSAHRSTCISPLNRVNRGGS